MNHRLEQSPPRKKEELAILARASRGGIVTVGEAARSLGVSTKAAAQRLAALTEAGWTARVRRGVYLILPLESASERQTTIEDPWILAVALYTPCYIAGWSAAEYWGLTEQLFRSTFVATAANIRKRSATYIGSAFTLVRVRADRVRGLTEVWRGVSRVAVSGRERTIIDAAIDPRWVGGLRHLADMFATYVSIPDSDPDALLAELRRFGTGAAAKRIGYLAERLWPSAKGLIEGALASRSTGIIKLDPALSRRGRIDTRWGLWVNTASIDSR